MIEDESYLKGKRQQVVQPGAMETLLEEQAAAADEELVAFQDSDMSDATTDDEDVEESGETSSGDAAFISSDEEELDPTQKSTTDDDLGIASAADALANLGRFLPFSFKNDKSGLDAEDPVEEEFVREMAMAALSHMDDKEFESNLEACWSRTIGNGFKRHKKNYYKEKLKFGNISKDQLKSQSEGYVRAIQWILHYYYHGCVSWNWYVVFLIFIGCRQNSGQNKDNETTRRVNCGLQLILLDTTVHAPCRFTLLLPVTITLFLLFQVL